LKKILDIVKYISYKHVKITIQNSFYNRIYKNDKIWRFEYVYYSLYSDPHFWHFCVAQTVNYFHLIFYRFVGYISGYIKIFSSNFFGIQKYNFRIFLKSEITEAWDPEISTPFYELIKRALPNPGRYCARSSSSYNFLTFWGIQLIWLFNNPDASSLEQIV
jgi:hypothetical protein